MNTVKTVKQVKGPTSRRCWIITLDVMLGILVYWLLGFVLSDINTLPRPSYDSVLVTFQNQELVKKQQDLQKEMMEMIALMVEVKD